MNSNKMQNSMEFQSGKKHFDDVNKKICEAKIEKELNEFIN